VERFSQGGAAVIDATHNPALASWVVIPVGHDFPVQNLPLGVASIGGGAPRGVTAIGDHVIDLGGLAAAGVIDADLGAFVAGPTLNALLGDAKARRRLRARLSAVLTDPAQRSAVAPHLYTVTDAAMHLPTAIGDYTDFYVGIHHARAIGALFRPDQPLLPNYKYVPIGYHGRASTVRVAGTPVVRPSGQRKAPSDPDPTFGPSRRLDFELEIAVWIGGGNALGAPIAIADATDHIAGLGLLNDWSARDLQAWEYVPLGPFLAKSFLTSVSPWIVTSEALAPFRRAQAPRPDGDPAPLAYLNDAGDQASGAFAIDLFVDLTTAAMRAAGMRPVRLAASVARHMYWTVAQMVAHHASNGCALNPGDLFGTGTLSGPDRSSCGSLMELSHNGAEPFALPDGDARSFLADGDEVIMSARARAEGFVSIGFGTCSGTVLPAV
jgi:fumarylacetoacetase